MKFYIDTADLNAVKRVNEYFPLEGFTTNPNLLTFAGDDLQEIFREYKEFCESFNKILFVQVTADCSEAMLSQAYSIYKYFGDIVVVKIPATREGFKAAKACAHEGLPVCVTVIHSLNQALMAAEAGADYAAIYVSHVDSIGADGAETVEEIVKVYKNYGYKTKLMGASFRMPDQIRRLACGGCHAVTIQECMFDLLVAHASTDESIKKFKDSWAGKFGNAEVSDFLAPIE